MKVGFVQVGADRDGAAQVGVAQVAAVPINIRRTPFISSRCCLRARIRFVGAVAVVCALGFAFDILARLRRSAGAQHAHHQGKGRNEQEAAQAA